MRIRSSHLCGAVLCATFALAVATVSAAPPARKAAAPAHNHLHGPHGGEMLALGNKEFYVEIFHDQPAKVLAVYLFDATGKNAIAIDAKELVVNLARNGRPEQHKLIPSPQAGDPAGTASLYFTRDEDLQAALDQHGVDARLSVAIGGRTYAAKLVHHHHH